MSLAVNLSGRLDAQSFVRALGSNLSGPVGRLAKVSVPISADDLRAATAGLSSIDSAPIGAAVGRVARRAEPLLHSLPIANDILRPLTGLVDLLEKATSGELTGALHGLKTRLTADLEGPGNIGALIKIAHVLSDAPESRVLHDIVHVASGTFQIQIPTQLPVNDMLQAADNSVRVIGGMMALESISSESERLTAAMAAQLDATGLKAQLTSLQAALDGTTAPLADVVAAVPPGDLARVAAAVTAVTGVAAQLDAIQQRFSTAMGFGEAALIYLDLDKVQAGLTAASTVLRTAELDSLRRVLARLSPITSGGLGAPSGVLNDLVAAAGRRVAELGNDIRSLEVDQLVAPINDAIATVAGFIGRINDVITQITVAFEAAMGTVKDAIAALPVRAIVDAINTFLQPITDVLGKIQQIINTVQSALKTTADATHALIGQVGSILDQFKHDVDTLFGGASDLVAQRNLDEVAGKINDGIRAFSEVLAKAEMKPYFDTADDVINTTADVISMIPFGLLPDSMKQKVDDAVKPIKAVDPSAVQREIEDLLDFAPDPNDPNKRVFAVRDIFNKAIHDVQVKYDQLLATIRTYDPHKYLATLDSELKKVADAVHAWSPALTLQPLTDAVNQVKGAIVGFDLESQLKPVHAVFKTIEDKIAELNPTRLVQPIEARIKAARAKLYDLIKIKQWIPAIDGMQAQIDTAIGQLDPDRLGVQLESGLNEVLASLDSPSVSLVRSLGSVVAAAAGGLGLPIAEASFEQVAAWLRGASGKAALQARMGRIADAVARSRDGVHSLDVQVLSTHIVERMAALRPAVAQLAAKLPASSSASISLTAAMPRLHADAVFASLAEQRTRYLASLVHQAELAQALRHRGFSEVDDGALRWQTALQPLAPALDLVAQLLAELGLPRLQIGLPRILAAILRAVSPKRLVGIVKPIFAALRDRLQSLVTRILVPVKNGIHQLNDLLDKIDLQPLIDALDGAVKKVQAQIAALDPVILLKAPLDAFKKLQSDLRTSNPVQQVIQIITQLRDAATALLQKLDSNKLLETPLQIYDHITGELSKLKLDHLLDPVFTQLDGIAEQVHAGLTNTVAAFVKLQSSLPGKGGGAGAAISGAVSVAGSIGL